MNWISFLLLSMLVTNEGRKLCGLPINSFKGRLDANYLLIMPLGDETFTSN